MGCEEMKPEERPLILCVEDDADTQWLIQTFLRDRFRVMPVSNGVRMREELDSCGDAIAAILMDLALEGPEDGIALTRSLQSSKWKRLPVIAITGHTYDIDPASAAGAGCAAYVTKPFTREDLLRAIEKFRLRH